MDMHTRTLLLLLAAIPLATATFFLFNTFRPPVYPSPRFRPPPPPLPRAPVPPRPPSNYIPLQSPIFGVRIYVPKNLYDLFNRPPGPESSFPRPYSPPFQPPPYHPPSSYFPENHPNDFPPNYLPPRGFPDRGNAPIDPDTFINLMRAFYPDLIYNPDPRYPNVFAVRIPNQPLPPPTHLPDYPLPHFEQGRQQQPQQQPQQQSFQPPQQQTFQQQPFQQPSFQQQPFQQDQSFQQQQPFQRDQPFQQQQPFQREQLFQQLQTQPNRPFNGQFSDNRNQFAAPSLSQFNNTPQLNRPQNQLIIIRSQ